MDGIGLTLLLGVLVLANAVFSGSEVALISLREGQLRRLERSPDRSARAVVRLARDPNRFLATIQIGITLAGFLASATAAVTLAQPLVPLLAWLGRAAAPAAITLVTLALAFLTLVLGELAPKRLAMQHALRWALLVARPLDRLATLSRPAVWLLSKATDLTVRTFGGDPRAAREQLSTGELRDLVAGHRGLTKEQRTIITGALEINERVLRRVLRPRGMVFTLPADLPVEQARAELARSGHSRAPVVPPSGLDDAAGVVGLRDLFGDHATAAQAARPPMLLPDTLRVSEALRRFKEERQRFGLVVGERGTIDGIVTLEDLLEEIVGEIYDETDGDVAAARADDDGTLTVPGTFPVHDLADIGVRLGDLPNGDYTTIAGLVLVVLGHIPQAPGELITVNGWTIEVAALAGHAITEVRLRAG
ncbi:hemolysin family protein [Amycolatopsis aidingensis]|uniref:hemolysin family protein n=1 Tax=Amycolatopsis aidingensis TaxID=2842453 RepID=UPI001C0C06E2|nr:hemolysin family protein [Amycolatopsis aidingensis]